MTRSRQQTAIVIVDDHPIVRQGLTQLIHQETDLHVCGHASTPREALDVIKTTRPALAIVDLSLKDASGLELVKDLHIHYPQVAVLVISIHDESLYAERVLRAGAHGYVMKQEASEQILKAIRRVLGGKIYLSETMIGKLLQQTAAGHPDSLGASIESLSDRELEVFQLIGQGLSTRQAAEQLYLSVKTVEAYRERIKEKLNLSSATALVQHAVLWTQRLPSAVRP